MSGKHIKRNGPAALEIGLIDVHCKILTTTNGTLSATVGANGGKGIASVAKVAAKTGRYKVTFDDNFGQMTEIDVAFSGTADAATVASKATGWKYRNKSLSGAAPSIEIQFTNGLADAELEDGCEALFTFRFKDSLV